MNNGKTIGSAITAFVIGFGGSLLSVPASGYAVNKTTILVSVVVGAMAAAKDWRSSNALPAITPENLQAMLQAYNVKFGTKATTNQDLPSTP